MPVIKSSADLRNNYNEISTFCHTYPEPVFITKNGKGDLAVMSIEAYEELTSRFELYGQIKEGLSYVYIPYSLVIQKEGSSAVANDTFL